MNINNLKSIQSIVELKQIGTEKEIDNFIHKIIIPLKIDASTYQEIYDSLEVLKQKHIDFIDSFFKSEQDEYLFYLTQLEGKQRNRLLGLTDEHYENRTLAKEWYKKISKFVHPDMNGNSNAFNTLKKIYDILIEEDKN